MPELNGFTAGEALEKEKLDENISWEDTIDTLSYELREAGVRENEARWAAAYFYAAYVEHQALLLAGPAGKSLADAVSVSVSGRTAAVLDAGVPYSKEISDEVRRSEDEIIVVKNMFLKDWIVPVMDLIESTRKEFIVVHPFPEDLFVEPKSLFFYALPMLTEQLIDRRAQTRFVGGQKTENFEKKPSQERQHYKVLRKMKLGPYQEKAITRLLDTMAALCPEEYAEIACRYLYYPLAYYTGQTENLAACVAELKIGTDTKNLFAGE